MLPIQLWDIVTREETETETSLPQCLIYCFGKTSQGQAVCVKVPYRPYFYLKTSPPLSSAGLQRALVNKLHRVTRLAPGSIQMTLEKKKLAYGFRPSDEEWSDTSPDTFYRLSFPNSQSYRMSFGFFKNRKDKFELCGSSFSLMLCEGNYNFSLVSKFLDEQNLVPCEWIAFPSTADLDLVTLTDYRQIVPYSNPLMAPIKVASVDIECCSMNGGFPVATNKEDPVIGIGVSLLVLGQPQPMSHFYFALHETRTSKMDLTVFWFRNELELILGFRKWLLEQDPDVITGYNILGFDFKYLCDRLAFYPGPHSDSFFYLSRLPEERTPLEKTQFSSAARGQKDFYTFKLAGRVILDMLETIRIEYKLRSYTLEFVAKHFLTCADCRKQELLECKKCIRKMDLDKKLLKPYFSEGPETRGKIAEYCSMDCAVVLHLLLKLCTIQNLVEMSKVTLTPLNDLLSRGQQNKVFKQIVWYAHRDNYVINDPLQGPVESYKGAKVLDPVTGYHRDPITVLDFASLYPSIMMTHNLCFSTWIQDPQVLESITDAEAGKVKKVTTTLGTYYFWQGKEGILPKILNTLLSARKQVKKQMAQESDPFQKSLLNGKQLALKLSANAVYGFCGTGNEGMYPCMAVSDATTCYGREMISTLKRAIEEQFSGSQVIYGDTDSVMVKFKLPSLDRTNLEDSTKQALLIKEAFQFGYETVALAKTLFSGRIELTMEKVFYGYISLTKKRYAGLMFENETDTGHVKESGVQSVRRDSALFLARTFSDVIRLLLEQHDVAGALARVRETMQALVDNTLPFEDYVMSCQLRKEYKNANQMQLIVVRKIKARSPGSEPKSGDRLQYVIVQVPSADRKPKYQRVEDASYARTHQLKLDRVYYFENLFEKPLTDLLEAFVKNPKETLFDPYRSKLRIQREGLQPLKAFLEQGREQAREQGQDQKSFLGPGSTRASVKKRKVSGPLSQYFTRPKTSSGP